MDISTRTKQLKAIFSYDKKIILEDHPWKFVRTILSKTWELKK